MFKAYTADSVTVDVNPACNQDSIFSKSRGDEPGNKKASVHDVGLLLSRCASIQG